MTRSGLAVLLILVAQPVWLAGQDARLRARLAPATLVKVERIIEAARAAGLPGEPLVQKALEGSTKGAAPERIVAVVAALAETLGRARDHLGANSSVDELQAGVLWLQAGGSEAALSQLRRAAEDRSLAVTLAVAAEWLGRGWPTAEAASTLVQFIRARISDGDLLTLRREVDAASRRGGAAVTVLRSESARMLGMPPP